jgi:hypothetical protein
MRKLIAIVIVVGAAAWAAAAASGDGGPSPGVSYGWEGVTTPNGRARYVALPAGRDTVVAVVRTQGGRVVRFRSLRGAYGVPLVAFDGTAGGLTHDGKTLALATFAPPQSRAVTRFALISTRTLRLRQMVTLRGSYAFDALSPDARTLYVIEYVSPQASNRYRVRAYDVGAGRLLTRAIADRRSRATTMRGSPATRAESADGRWAYTLYAGGHHPFIHALDTVGRAAVCIDLPWRGSQDRLFRLRLTTSADGAKLVLLTRKGRTVLAVKAPR